MKKAEKEAEEIRKTKLEEIRQMQREAEEEVEKKVAISCLIGGILADKQKKLKIEKENVVKYWINKTGIIEDSGFNLTKRIDTSDHDYIEEEGGIIPKNYGSGIKIIDDKGQVLFTPEPDKNPEVELRISTWMGTSAGAIHYYGVLQFSAPWFHYKDGHGSTLPGDIKICGSNKIELTHPLEAWELRDYPGSYKCWRVGDYYRGFYTVDDVIKVGKEFFKEYFEKGWKLKITEL